MKPKGTKHHSKIKFNKSAKGLTPSNKKTSGISNDLAQARELIKSLQEEDAFLHSLNDFEDRSMHSNIIFHGVTDSRSETRAQTEGKIVELLCRSVEPEITSENIGRAYRLGPFS